MKNKYDCFNPSIKRIIVHAGKFDADAVLCIAMTMCVNENIEIFRVGRVTDDMYNEDNIVCDIGYGKYDHHQENAPKREDGYTHSACGLLFEDMKDYIFPGNKALQEDFRENVINFIEILDNGHDIPNKFAGKSRLALDISSSVEGFNVPWNREYIDLEKEIEERLIFISKLMHKELLLEYENSYFLKNRGIFNSKRVEYRISLLSMDIENVNSTALNEAKEVVLKALEESDGRIVELNNYRIPWQDILSETTAEFVIYPVQRGNVKTVGIKTVPAKGRRLEPKRKIPKDIFNFEKHTFVHSGQFYACKEYSTNEQYNEIVSEIKKRLKSTCYC